MSGRILGIDVLPVSNGETSAEFSGACYSVQVVDLACEREVLRGQPAGRVADQGQRHLVPADKDVWVVVGLLGEVADGVQVQQRVAEVLAGHRLGDLPVRYLPAGGRGELRGDLFCGESRHATVFSRGTTPGTPAWGATRPPYPRGRTTPGTPAW